MAAVKEEIEVMKVQDHRGKKRSEMEYVILWTDGDETWKSWEQVKENAELDEYVMYVSSGG